MPDPVEIIEHTRSHESDPGFFNFIPGHPFDIAMCQQQGIPEKFISNKYVKCNKSGCNAIFKRININHECEPKRIGLIQIDFEENPVSTRVIDVDGVEIHA